MRKVFIGIVVVALLALTVVASADLPVTHELGVVGTIPTHWEFSVSPDATITATEAEMDPEHASWVELSEYIDVHIASNQPLLMSRDLGHSLNMTPGTKTYWLPTCWRTIWLSGCTMKAFWGDVPTWYNLYGGDTMYDQGLYDHAQYGHANTDPAPFTRPFGIASTNLRFNPHLTGPVDGLYYDVDLPQDNPTKWTEAAVPLSPGVMNARYRVQIWRSGLLDPAGDYSNSSNPVTITYTVDWTISGW